MSTLEALCGLPPGWRAGAVGGQELPFNGHNARAMTPGERARFASDLRHCGPGYRSQEERIGYPDLTPYADPGLIAALPTGGER